MQKLLEFQKSGLIAYGLYSAYKKYIEDHIDFNLQKINAIEKKNELLGHFADSHFSNHLTDNEYL